MPPRLPQPEAFTSPPPPPPRPSTGFLRPSLTPTLPALFVSLTVLALLLALLLVLNLRPRPARRRDNGNRRSLHEMSSRRQSLYDFTGFNVAAGPEAASPRSSMYIPYLILGFADDANQPLLQRYRDDPDDPSLELYEATWQRRDGKGGRPDLMHWHGTNMLNTAWGWMA